MAQHKGNGKRAQIVERDLPPGYFRQIDYESSGRFFSVVSPTPPLSRSLSRAVFGAVYGVGSDGMFCESV